MTAASTGGEHVRDMIGASAIDKDAHLLLITALGGVRQVCGSCIPFCAGIPDPKDFDIFKNFSDLVFIQHLVTVHVLQTKSHMPDSVDWYPQIEPV